jgi:signal transduction histidine kinase/ligand-binding sensor domain-containing protein
LPATIYTTANGLASNNVNKILADSRGFIWFATREGVSRFDGYGFTNYGVDDGLPSSVVNDLLETRNGVYLFATDAGLARLEPVSPSSHADGSHAAAHPLFSVHPVSPDPASRAVLTLYESRGGIWLGTRAGLFQVENAAGDMKFHAVAIGRTPGDPIVLGICADRFGTLWVATARGLRRVWPDSHVDLLFPDFGVHSVLEDRGGRIWAGTRSNGLVEVVLDSESGRVTRSRVYTSSSGLPHTWINQLLEGADGELWAASPSGLVQLTSTSPESTRIRVFGDAQGLGRGQFESMALDRSGNLWVATLHAGAIKIARSGFSSYGPVDGIPWANSLLQTRSGALCFLGPVNNGWGLLCSNGSAFDRIQPRLVPGAGTFSWGWNRMVLEDHTGEWWFATREGVARMGKAARPQDLEGRAPARWYGTADGLAASVILGLFEDSRGDVWISAVGEGSRNGVSRWQRSTTRLVHYNGAVNLPDLNRYFVTAFGEDRSGNVWIGFSGGGGIARYRNGGFDRLDGKDLFPAMVRNIFCDSTGRMWVGSYDGLVRIDNPGAESPRFTRYTTKAGLSSNEATAMVQDLEGRLYIGTGRGVDRLDPDSGRVRHYSARDGYVPAEIGSALLDQRTGHLWFAEHAGVSRLIVPPDRSAPPPPILITDLEVAGRPVAINPLGETVLPTLEIEPNRSNLRIQFVALGFDPGEDLRYQYRLEGAQDDWSAPSPQRAVNFASLSPGTYRFAARALSADGVASLHPATMEFTVLRPVWQRRWFVAIVTAAAACLLYAAYRYRLRRALEVAAVRTRIASDLHDDIGANLTKIAILSEVARQDLDSHGVVSDRLSAIARISRESVASMSDVVWAINPRRDNLQDTVRRMRQHAEEVLAGRSVTLAFDALDAERNVRVPIEVRRDFFLIFKEALNNAVRHSKCRAIAIAIRADGARLHFLVTDDGIGFDSSLVTAGNGLTGMRRRASDLNALLEVVSSPGQGTSVRLSVGGSIRGGLRRPA